MVPGRVWNDPDRRRALLLSLTLHLTVLLLLAVFLSLPKPQKLDTYLVIDLGTPAQSDVTTQAATAESPAPPAPTPQVEAPTTGEPQARSAPQPQAQAPQPQETTVQPPAPATPPAQAAAPQAATATQPRSVARAPAPAPREPQAAPAPAPAPPAEQSATTLPPIDPVQLQPRALAPSVTIPAPQARADVPDTRTLATTPRVEVAPERPLAEPQASAALAPSTPLRAPEATAEVAPERTLAAPQARADVAGATALTPPQVEAQVAGARSLDAPQVGASVAASRTLAPPRASANAGVARDVTVAPSIAVTAPRNVPLPSVRATVETPAPAGGAPAAADAPPGNTTVAATRPGDRPVGGNAASPGQTGGEPLAAAAGRGRASSPDGSGAGTGAPPSPAPAPYREERERPLSVLVDNVDGYPQAGLQSASSIVEMPVEGGLTRLMLNFDRSDPGRVGPVRSARDYFVTLANSMDAVLVHDGGSPGAIAAIQRSPLPTLNAFRRGDLFSRSDDRSAPYNLYSQGQALRQAVNRLLPPRTRVLSGTFFRPSEDAPTVLSVTVRFGATYKTGFRYFPTLDRYRWVRNGQGASDASGEDVTVDAVLVGKILARPLPDDPAGRLYIPLEGGPATLYLRGRAVAGHWELGQGVRFSTADGEVVDLAPFRTWIVLTPTYDQRAEQ